MTISVIFNHRIQHLEFFSYLLLEIAVKPDLLDFYQRTFVCGDGFF